MISFSSSNYIQLPMAQQVDRLDVEDLVREVERHRPLWDTACEEYASKQERDRHWDEVIAHFLPDYQRRAGADRLEIGSLFRRRWKSMRTCYARELSRQKSSSGRFRRKYLYYDLLRFLDPVTRTQPRPGARGGRASGKSEPAGEGEYEGAERRKRPGRTPVKPEPDGEEEEETGRRKRPRRKSGKSVQPEPDGEEEETGRRKRPRRTSGKSAEPVADEEEEDPPSAEEVKAASRPHPRRSNAANDEADRMFLMSLVSDFQSVPARNKTKLKMEILEAIARAQGGCGRPSRGIDLRFDDVRSPMDLAEVKMEAHEPSGSDGVDSDGGSDADDWS